MLSLQLTPEHPSLAANGSLQLTVIGTYVDGSTRDLSGEVHWSVPSAQYLSVSPTGMLHASWPGSYRVSASLEQLSVSADVTVEDVPASLRVSIESEALWVGGTASAFAELTTVGGLKQDVTTAVTWSVDSSEVVTIDASGQLQLLKEGTVAVVAQLEGLRAQALLRVGPLTITSLRIESDVPSLPKGKSTTMRCFATWSDGSQTNETTRARWSTSSNAIVHVPGGGLVQAVGVGMASVGARIDGISTSVVLTVTSALPATLSLYADGTSLFVGHSLQVTASGKLSDGQIWMVSAPAWSVSDPAIAMVSSDGLVTGVGPGTVKITAESSGLSASLALQVVPATLTWVTIAPAVTNLAYGASSSLVALGDYSDGERRDVTAVASWRSQNTRIVTIDSSGTARGVSEGNTQITASFEGKTGSAFVYVAAPVPTGLRITPGDPSIPLGDSQLMTVVQVLQDGSSRAIQSGVRWTTDAPDIASVNAYESLLTYKQGIARITASFNGLSASITVSVGPPRLIQAQVFSTSTTYWVGDTAALGFVVTDSRGTITDVRAMTTWAVSALTIASVSADGTLTALAAGAVTVIGSYRGLTASLTLQIRPPYLTGIDVPDPVFVPKGLTQQLYATGHYSNGVDQILTSGVTWTVLNGSGGTVTADGLVTAMQYGSLNVRATCQFFIASCGVVVTAPIITEITVSVSQGPFHPGDRIAVVVRDVLSDGTTRIHAAPVLESSDTDIAAFDSDGRLTMLAPGTATITARVGDFTAVVTVTVESPE